MFESFCVIKSSQLRVTEFLEFKNLTHTYSNFEILYHHGIPNDSKGVGDHWIEKVYRKVIGSENSLSKGSCTRQKKVP